MVTLTCSSATMLPTSWVLRSYLSSAITVGPPQGENGWLPSRDQLDAGSVAPVRSEGHGVSEQMPERPPPSLSVHEYNGLRVALPLHPFLCKEGVMKIIGTVLVMAALSTGLLAVPASADLTINIGAPPPPIVIAAPPKVVVVPGTPVYY